MGEPKSIDTIQNGCQDEATNIMIPYTFQVIYIVTYKRLNESTIEESLVLFHEYIMGFLQSRYSSHVHNGSRSLPRNGPIRHRRPVGYYSPPGQPFLLL